MENTTSLSRRHFVEGAGLAAGAVVAASAVTTVAKADEGAPSEQAWDDECDILVVGYGGAGAAAAITAAEEGLGDVLVIEAAPEGEEGGNTRASAQLIFSPDPVDGAIEYQTNLNADYVVPEDCVRAWAEEINKNGEWLESLGFTVVESSTSSPEFPDVEGCEASRNYLVDGVLGSQSLWLALKSMEAELGLRVSYDTRAMDLITENGEVHGVIAETNNGSINIKAKKAVILACGGFENDADMLSNYFPLGMNGDYIIPCGTPFNRGDGIRMAQRLGCGLWHMNNFSRGGTAVPCCLDHDDIYNRCGTFPSYGTNKDFIIVDPTAERYAYEETLELTRHGKTQIDGVYMDLQMPQPSYLIFGSDMFENQRICSWLPYITAWVCDIMDADGTNASDLEKGLMIKGDTPAELAEQLGLDPDVLTATIDEYNTNAANNEDPIFGRGQAYYSTNIDMTGRHETAVNNEGLETDEESPSIDAFNLVPLEAPYYAMRLGIGLVNSQGGPTRSPKGEITDVDGNPIPRLFSAGEMGCIYSYMYNGGGNVGEALASGRIAIRNAAALDSWE